ncbi:MAG: STAS domain-containing protein [Alphaproteobacteria bacterium]|nr:STAS domain-containing protein [Alphaproteobacteria bacterium]
MEIKVEVKQNITILTPIGRIDTATAKAFEEGISQHLKEKIQLVISFEEINYISSAGLRVILMAGKKQMAGHGKLGLINMPDKIYTVFKMSGFDKIIKIYKDFDTACKLLQSETASF